MKYILDYRWRFHLNLEPERGKLYYICTADSYSEWGLSNYLSSPVLYGNKNIYIPKGDVVLFLETIKQIGPMPEYYVGYQSIMEFYKVIYKNRVIKLPNLGNTIFINVDDKYDYWYNP